MKVIRIHDIVEENGKTIKENNLEKKHNIDIGTLVETDKGIRLVVTEHRRDCDGTPLYVLGVENKNMLFGYAEEYLKVVTQ